MKRAVVLLKKIVVAGIVVVVVFAGFYALIRCFPFEQVCFNDACFHVELALTPHARSQGLMFRKFLPQNRGMLFVFGDDDYWTFWMKNTYVPLDMVWLNAEREVVHMVANAPPATEDNTPQYMPMIPARYVLEVNAGFCKKHNIKLGDQARFKWIFLPKKI